MSSSFDTKNELEYEDIWASAAALYCHLKQGTYGVRRAELKQGQVATETVDFLCDFENRCKQSLNPTQYKLTLQHTTEDKYLGIPKTIQRLLGKLFLETDLSVSGHYKVLYFRAKNARLQDRDEPTHFPEGEL